MLLVCTYVMQGRATILPLGLTEETRSAVVAVALQLVCSLADTAWTLFAAVNP